MVLNLKDERGKRILEQLVKKSDVLVENYRPNVKKRLGIDYESLRPLNPRLVYASISGFGQTGPYQDRPGYDQVAQGMGGLMSITGQPGGGPVRAGIPVADLSAGLLAAQGIFRCPARTRTVRRRPVGPYLTPGSYGRHAGLSGYALAHGQRSAAPGRQ